MATAQSSPDSQLTALAVVAVDAVGIIRRVNTNNTSNSPTRIRTARINIAAAGLAPDRSGKSAFQYSALIGSYDAAFCNLYEAQRALLETSSADDGYNNFVFTTNGPTTCTLLVW